MKKKIIALFALVALFGLAIATYAYTTASSTTSTSCCCKKDGDSCPMKGKGHDDKDGHAKMSCCKKHDSDHAKTEGHSCDCCGDSCPMKKKEGNTATSDSKSCCDDCDCCKGKHEPKV